jgi:hypothetical protein
LAACRLWLAFLSCQWHKNDNPAGHIACRALRGAFASVEPWKSLSQAAGKGAGTVSNHADASLAATLRDGLCAGAWKGR